MTYFQVLALRALAEMAKPPHARGELGVVGAHRATVSESANVVARIERERGGRAERARSPAAVARPVRLRGVFENEQAVRLGERLDSGHVARLTIEMDGEDCRGA